LLSENSKAGFILLAAVLFGVYCFVFGQSGILERMRLQKEKLLLQGEISLLQKENASLTSLLAGHSSGRLAKSECENAGYLSPGGRVYHFLNAPASDAGSGKKKASQLFSIEHLRIAWITFSAFAMAGFYFLVRRTRRQRAVEVTRMDDEIQN
jgi:cell division protein FtsB